MQKPLFLGLLLTLQILCTAFFVFDSTLDALGLTEGPFARGKQAFEYAMTIALVGSVILSALTLRTMLKTQQRLDSQVAIAAGALEDVMAHQFRAWALTPAETEVARMAVQGLSISEMAELRGTAEGTIKAHSAAVYRKAGVSGRLQLISYFIEDLLDEAPLREVWNS